LSYQHIDPELAAASADNRAAEKVNFRFALLSNYEARVQLTSAPGHNYSVTDEIFPRPVQEFEARFTQLGFQHSEAGKPFDWSLANIFTDEPVLSTKNRKFLVGDKFSEIGLLLPNDRIFGLGLSNREFRIGTDATYTLWSRGRQNEPMPEDTGKGGAEGAQVLPFLLGQTHNKQDWYGIFFVGGAPSAFEVVKVANSSNVILNYLTMSDQMEMYIIMRGSAKFIIQKYQHQIGRPALPPFYALGIYTGSQLDPAWGSPTEIYKKIDSYIAANMPIEGVVLDQYTHENICPFQSALGFNLAEMRGNLTKNKMKMYLSVQAGIPVGDGRCEAYKIAAEKGCLLVQEGTSNDTVGIGKAFNATGDRAEDFFGMALIDVFSKENASSCMAALFDNLGLSAASLDGIYLRDSSPYTVSNGSDLEIAKYVRRAGIEGDRLGPNEAEP